jgi:cytidylate kinase
MPSVGKTTAAESIAKQFRLRIIGGGDMLKQMAIDRGYDPSGSDWWDMPEGMKFLSERERNTDFDKEVDRRLAKYVKHGGVVITSYSIPWLCKNGIKFWFHASRKARARRLAGRDKISFSKALAILKKRDSENRRLYKRLYNIRFGDDLSVFNFIIDTEKMSAKEVAKTACKLVKEVASS